MAKSSSEFPSSFICMICLETPKDPENCQHCSQFVCRLCIDNWFRKSSSKNGLSSCPQCRKATQRCHFKKLACLQDLLKVINDRDKELEHSKSNECSQHSKQQLCVYCLTCSKAICAQCILPLFNGEHIDHTYCQLNAAQERLGKLFDEQENNFQLDLEQLTKSIENKNCVIDQILMRKAELVDEVQEFRDLLLTEIKSEVRKMVNEFEVERNLLMKEVDNYKMKRNKLRNLIESSNLIELFQQEKELSEQILERAKIPDDHPVDLSNINLHNPLLILCEEYELTVKNFSFQRQTNDPVLSSPIRFNYNQHWSFAVYPNGKDPYIGDYLSVSIELKKGIPQPVDYEFIIELVHHLHDDDKHNYSRKNTRPFKEGQIYTVEGFYPLNKLTNDGFLNPETDSIQMRFKLQPKSILEERKLFQWQIEFYEKEEQKWEEQEEEMDKVKDELIRLEKEKKEDEQIIEDLRNQIKELERNSLPLKRKRTASNRATKN